MYCSGFERIAVHGIQRYFEKQLDGVTCIYYNGFKRVSRITLTQVVTTLKHAVQLLEEVTYKYCNGLEIMVITGTKPLAVQLLEEVT